MVLTLFIVGLALAIALAATGFSHTHFAEAAIQNRVYRNNSGTPTFPTTIYAGLFTASPGEAGTQSTELTVSGYTRQAVAFGAPASQTLGSLIANTGSINWGTPATTNGEVAVYIGLLDASSAGNMWDYGLLASSITVTAGVPIVAAVGAITQLED